MNVTARSNSQVWSHLPGNEILHAICFIPTSIMTGSPLVLYLSLFFSDGALLLWLNTGLHGGDYEECRLLGYKIPVRTPRETHYFSVIETMRLMLCKIWGFRGGDYDECRLLGDKKNSSYPTGNTLLLRYRNKAVNVMKDLRVSRRWLWWMPSSGI
jgi:hypothetical protein